MHNNEPQVTIIILNWESWQDTLECLESVLNSNYKNFRIILVDNNSQDESVEKIIMWAKGNLENKIVTDFPELVYPEIEKPVKIDLIENIDADNFTFPSREARIYLIKNQMNSGFARGNNLAIEYAIENFQQKYFYLLNNDIVVRPDTLVKLVEAVEKDENIGVAQTVNYYYNSPDQIHYAGGKISFWGVFRGYKEIGENEVKAVTAINGASLLLKTELLKEHGYLTEKFFFGEEDRELSIRYEKLRIKKVCVGASKIYHKIGASKEKFKEEDEFKRLKIHIANRIIHMKSHYPCLIWEIWRIIVLVYITTKYDVKINFFNKLYKFTSVNNAVTLEGIKELTD